MENTFSSNNSFNRPECNVPVAKAICSVNKEDAVQEFTAQLVSYKHQTSLVNISTLYLSLWQISKGFGQMVETLIGEGGARPMIYFLGADAKAKPSSSWRELKPAD